MKRLTSALLLLAILFSSLPWEVSAVVAPDSGGDAASTVLQLPGRAGSEGPLDIPAADDGACLCPICPGAATDGDASAHPDRVSMPLIGAALTAPIDALRSTDELSRFFRPPRAR